MKKFDVFALPVPCPACGAPTSNQDRSMFFAYWKNEGYGRWSNSSCSWKNSDGWSNSSRSWRNDGYGQWSNSSHSWKNNAGWSNSSCTWKNSDGWSNSSGSGK